MATEYAFEAEPNKAPKFSGTLADLLDRVTYRRVCLSDPTHPIYRHRYEAYRHAGYVAESAAKALRDDFDDAPNAYCFGVYIDEWLVASVRIQHVTPDQRSSLSRTLWPDVLDPILDAGESFIDPTRLTTDHEASLAYPALPFLALRIVTMAAEYFGVRYCLHSVTTGHGGFYERVFGSKLAGEARPYSAHIKEPVPVAMYIAEIEELKERVKNRFPVFMSTEAEREALFGGVGDEVYERRIVPSALEAYREHYREAIPAA